MAIIIDVILILISFVLQSSLFPHLSIAGICPNVLIILVSSVSFMRGQNEGMLTGFFSGLLMDVFFGDILGLYSLIFVVLGYLNGKFYGFFYAEDIKFPAILITLSDLTCGVLLYISLFLLRGRTDFWFYFTRVILGEVIYTLFISLIFYPLFLLCNNLLNRFYNRRAE